MTARLCLLMKRYLVFWCECEVCSEQYEFLGTYDGTRQLRSFKNMMDAVEVSWSNPVFDEIGNLVDKHLAMKNAKKSASDIFDVVFGNLCDPIASGVYYDMTGTLWCPNCGSKDASRYGPTEPPRYWEGELPEVKHTLG